MFYTIIKVREYTASNKSRGLFPAELSEVGSSAGLPLPVADEGSLAESPRSKREAAHLVCAASSSGTASVIDEIGGKIKYAIGRYTIAGGR